MVFYNHESHYAALVVRQRPADASSALDVGCGDGRYTVLLRQAAIPRVVGLDVEPSVLPDEGAAGITWRSGDFLTYDFSDSFDFIISMASVHHMPLREALTRMKELLAPNGVIAILGLYRPTTLLDRALDVPAFAANQYFGWTRTTTQTAGPIRPPSLALREIAAVARDVLPGAKLRRLLLWRYLMTWSAA